MNWLVRLRDRVIGLNKTKYVFRQEMRKCESQYRELKALEIIKPYLPKGFVIETAFSMPFQAIQHVLNDIAIYRPDTILEFGSGLSTQVISAFLETEGIPSRFISIDEDSIWQSKLGLSGAKVELLTFPLESESSFSYQMKGSWFQIPDDHEIRKLQYDLVLVDAPKGTNCALSRYGVIPFLQKNLSANSILYFDDTDRPDEYQIAILAQEEFEFLQQKHVFSRYTRLSGKEVFYTKPS